MQQVFVDVESHEMKDRPEEHLHLTKTVHTVPSDMTVNEYPSEKRTMLKSLASDSTVA